MTTTPPSTSITLVDGKWVPAQPIGWQGNTLDFEVYRAGGGPRHGYDAYWRGELVARRYPRTRLGLEISMMATARRWRRAVRREEKTR